jgi:hypothetical protein|tara:strand:- start:1892 stop:2266 length:375 start_codon:yes stop_codon:yes gene_type:complete
MGIRNTIQRHFIHYIVNKRYPSKGPLSEFGAMCEAKIKVSEELADCIHYLYNHKTWFLEGATYVTSDSNGLSVRHTPEESKDFLISKMEKLLSEIPESKYKKMPDALKTVIDQSRELVHDYQKS